MSKPICKAECDWDFWRIDRPYLVNDLKKCFFKYEKRIMNRARRRFNKEIINEQLRDSND